MASTDEAPGMRLPSWKISVGVPLTPSLRPSCRLASSGCLQSAAAAGGALPSSISAFQVAARSFAHQMPLAFSVESGERIGYRKMYSV